MTTKKVVSTWPIALRTSSVAANAVAYNHVAESLVGKTAWLYEHATGQSVSGSQTPQTPMNPQGRYGHDHSGPPYGPAIQHTLTSWFSTGFGNFTGQWNKEFSHAILGAYPGTGMKKCHFYDDVWIRPFPNWIAGTPYSKAWLTIAVYPFYTSPNLTVRAGNMTKDAPVRSYSRIQTATITVSTPGGGWSYDDYFWYVNLLNIDVHPGVNRFFVEFETDRPDDILEIIGYAWGQTKSLDQKLR